MLAPVLLFTYNRPEHTKLTIEALKNNRLSSQTDLFIFSDGPKSEKDYSLVLEVRDLLRTITGFASIHLVERQTNMGLAGSIIAGVSEVLKKYDQVIVLEDDLITSPHFLSYMNNALEHYQNDMHAFSITGHTFPQSHLEIPNDYYHDTYAGYRCSSWSWGTWRNRWESIDWEMEYFPSFKCNTSAQLEFTRGGQDLITILNMQYEGQIDSWAIRFCYAHYANGMKCIYPVKTLVRNIGLDNSGTHSKPDARFSHSTLDLDWNPQNFCSAMKIDERIARKFRAIFDSSSILAPFSIKYKVLKLVERTSKVLKRTSRIFKKSSKQVDILIVNTYQKNGGAARAAYRIFSGIRQKFPKAIYLTLFCETPEAGVIGLLGKTLRGALAEKLISNEQRPLKAYPNKKNSFFSTALFPNPFRIPISRFDPKLIHLHWVGRGMVSIEEIAKIKCPIIWTLHDAWPFTGGCHYPGDCQNYIDQCGCCPQLGSNSINDLSHKLLQRKDIAFNDLDITVVTPSKWLADKAANSHLFSGKRIKVIPNGLDTNVFKPIERFEALASLGINLDQSPVLLFGAHWLQDERKGGDILYEALSMLDRPYTLLTFGEGGLPLHNAPNINVFHLGSIHDNKKLALLYSAADIFICPSREDNLPNTVAEAMACGTPCVAFDINGLPDMISHGVNGWLAMPFKAADLARGINWIASYSKPEELRQAARIKALSEFSLEVMTKRYVNLYEDILQSRKNKAMFKVL